MITELTPQMYKTLDALADSLFLTRLPGGSERDYDRARQALRRAGYIEWGPFGRDGKNGWRLTVDGSKALVSLPILGNPESRWQSP